MNVALRTTLVATLLAVGGALSTQAIAQDRKPPQVLDLSKLKFQIVDATFVSSLDAGEGKFQETSPEKYRGMVLTVKITKPAGEELTLPCQDLVLHYRFGQKSDVARCYGISAFSTDQGVDRAMRLSAQGNFSSSTGVATTKSGTVFVDIFYQYMEPETHELYLTIAQPVGAYFETPGWKK